MSLSDNIVSSVAHKANRRAALAKSLPLAATDLLLLVLGLILNIVSYDDPLLIPVAIIFFVFGYTILILSPWSSTWEQRIFLRLFAVGWVAMGVSAFYDFILRSRDFYVTDASGFFDAARGVYRDYTLADLLTTHEGGVAIKIWQAAYDSFALLGFPKERYIGILVNILAVAFSGVVAIRTAKLIYGTDHQRLRRMFYMVSLCSLFWLFAGMHYRDALVLCTVTVLIGLWVWFLRSPSLGYRLIVTSIVSIVSVGLLQSLRNEFLFLPIAFACAATAAILFSHGNSVSRRWRWLFLVLFVPVVAWIVVVNYGQLNLLLQYNATQYLTLRGGLNASTNPGWVLAYQSPWYLQLLFRPTVMFIFPIPFWQSLQLDSAYILFKGLFAPFFYFLIPLGVITIRHLISIAPLRTIQQLFLLFTSIGMTLAIAFTSGETRHLGAFLTPIFLLLLLPDLHDHRTRRSYRLLLGSFLFIMALAHGFWLLRRL